MTAEQIQALLNGTTPGPWECQIGHSDWGMPRVNAITTIGADYHDPNAWIAEIHSTTPYCLGALVKERRQSAASDANARLIAAAPDLAQAALTAMAERDALQARHDDDREELDRMTAEMEERHERFVALQARVKALEAGLAWYGEQSRLARLIHSEGDAGRHAIANDGGAKARALLSKGSPEKKPTDYEIKVAQKEKDFPNGF